MILKALYDYYNRCGNLPAFGMEEKEIGFVIVISKEGKFVRFEDCRLDSKQARTYLVKKHVGRSSAIVANYLYDNSSYVLGYAENEKAKKDVEEQTKKRSDKENACLEAFKEKVDSIYKVYPENNDLAAICKFYQQSKEEILACISQDSLWEEIKKNLSKKYSTFSFRIDGDLKIVAEKKEILQLEYSEDDNKGNGFCLITGNKGITVDTTTATMIPGSQATAKLVAFQVNSGYDSYGKKKCENAPISKDAEFAYTVVS